MDAGKSTVTLAMILVLGATFSSDGASPWLLAGELVLGVFAAIGLPGFANFAGEIMIFFGAFRNGWEIGRFHMFQIATVLALWGVVLSTVYMLRAYRKTFMGTVREQWEKLPDLRPVLRVPVTLLVVALLCYGFFPQLFVRMITPAFRTYFSGRAINDVQTRSDGGMRRLQTVCLSQEDAPPAFANATADRQDSGLFPVPTQDSELRTQDWPSPARP